MREEDVLHPPLPSRIDADEPAAEGLGTVHGDLRTGSGRTPGGTRASQARRSRCSTWASECERPHRPTGSDRWCVRRRSTVSASGPMIAIIDRAPVTSQGHAIGELLAHGCREVGARRARAPVAARSGTRRCPRPRQVRRRASGISSLVRCGQVATVRAIQPSGRLAGNRRRHEPSVALLVRCSRIAQPLARAMTSRPGESLRGRLRLPTDRNSRTLMPFSLAPLGIEELHPCARVIGYRLSRRSARRSGHRRRRGRAEPLASPINLVRAPGSLRTLVTRPDEHTVDDDLAALDGNLPGRALEADEHPYRGRARRPARSPYLPTKSPACRPSRSRASRPRAGSSESVSCARIVPLLEPQDSLWLETKGRSHDRPRSMRTSQTCSACGPAGEARSRARRRIRCAARGRGRPRPDRLTGVEVGEALRSTCRASVTRSISVAGVGPGHARSAGSDPVTMDQLRRLMNQTAFHHVNHW